MPIFTYDLTKNYHEKNIHPQLLAKKEWKNLKSINFIAKRFLNIQSSNMVWLAINNFYKPSVTCSKLCKTLYNIKNWWFKLFYISNLMIKMKLKFKSIAIQKRCSILKEKNFSIHNVYLFDGFSYRHQYLKGTFSTWSHTQIRRFFVNLWIRINSIGDIYYWLSMWL